MKRLVLLAILASLLTACKGAEAPVIPVTEASSTRTIAVETTEHPSVTTQMVDGKLWAIPRGMDLERYPIVNRPAPRQLTAEEVGRMKLHQETIPTGTAFYNEDAKRQAFFLDIAKVGEKGWYNEMGQLVYVAGCANRAMEPVTNTACPASAVCNGPHLATGNGVGTGTSNSTADTRALTSGKSGSGFTVPGWLKSLFYGIGVLALALLAHALLLTLLALAFLIARVLYDLIRNGGNRAAVAQPAPIVAQPVAQRLPAGVRRRQAALRQAAAAAAPAQPAAQPQVANPRFVSLGIYDDAHVSNAGADGFRVIAFNGDDEADLGVWTWADIQAVEGGREEVWVQLP